MNTPDPRHIGPYQVLGRLGAGGMGQVVLGVSPGGRKVAIKLIRPELADDPMFRERFRREVGAARRVGGAFTVPVLDADTDATQPWLATAYVDGPSLDAAVTRYGRWTEPALRRLGAGLAEAMAAIHRCGLIHRDLKPGNILLTANGPMVIDFGISRATDGTALTAHGKVVGTPQYMAPEQIDPETTLTGAADVFALGGVLVFAATGRPPFGNGPVQVILARIMHAEPDLTGVPEPLRPLIAACLVKDPERRPTLDALLGGFAAEPGASWLPAAVRADLASRGMRSTPRPVRRAPSRRTFIVLGSVLGAAGVGAAVAATWEGTRGHGTRGRPVASATGTIGTVLGPARGPAPLWSTSPTGRTAGMALAGDVLVLATTSGPVGLSSQTGRPRWSRADGSLLAPIAEVRIAAAGGVAYVPDVQGGIHEYSATTGGPAGLLPPVAHAGQVCGIAGGLIHVWGDKSAVPPTGLLSTLDQESGAVRWQREIDASCRPVLAGALLYAVGVDGRILALDARSGAVRWSVRGATSPSVVVAGGTVVAVRTALTGLDAATGAVRWQAAGRPRSLGAGGGWVCAISGPPSRAVQGYDAATGARRWSIRLPSAGTAPETSSRFAAVSLGGAGFTLVDAVAGRTRWTYQTPGDAQATWLLLVTDTRVFASDGARVMAFAT